MPRGPRTRKKDAETVVPGKCKLPDGTLVDDPDDIADMRRKGMIPRDAVPEIDEMPEGGQTVEEIAEEIEERRAIQDDVTDDDWLDGLPLCSVLEGKVLKRFRADAMQVRRMRHATAAFKAAASSLMGHVWKGIFSGRVEYLLSLPDPKTWAACPRPEEHTGGCGGTGVGEFGECPKCRGRGYVDRIRD